MNSTAPLDDANNLVVRHLIHRYLADPNEAILSVEGACVVTQRIGNRHGVPRDAVTYLHTVDHPDLGFGFDVRSVRRCGRLMEPVAVHTTIVDYDDKGDHGNDAALRLAVNEWLQTVPL